MSPVSGKIGGNRGNAGKGRPKGARNKTTASVKAALTQAFDQLGGVKSLKAWADENPTEFYKLWGRMLPQEIGGKDGGPIEHAVTQVWQFGDKRVSF